MSLVIECDSCNSRFRLDPALVKGNGIRVYCRKCGAAIIVLSSEVSRLPTTEPEAEQAPVPGPEPAKAPPESPEKPFSLLRDIPFPPPSSPLPPPLAPSPGPSPASPPAPAPGSFSFPEPAAPRDVPRRPVFRLPPAPPWFLDPPVLALAVLVLLLAGIAGFITFTSSGQKALEAVVSAVLSIWRR